MVAGYGLMETFLNIADFFFNHLVGDVYIGLFIGLLIIFILAIYSRMEHEITILLSIIWVFIIFEYTQIILIWVGIITLVAFVIYYYLSKAIGTLR